MIKYSPSEEKILALLDKKPASSIDITRRFYAGRRLPLNGKIIVSGHLRGLREKAKRKREKWRVHSSERRGPHPIEWWIE